MQELKGFNLYCQTNIEFYLIILLIIKLPLKLCLCNKYVKVNHTKYTSSEQVTVSQLFSSVVFVFYEFGCTIGLLTRFSLMHLKKLKFLPDLMHFKLAFVFTEEVTITEIFVTSESDIELEMIHLAKF